MTCFSPLRAWRGRDGEPLVFSRGPSRVGPLPPRAGTGIQQELKIPCGQCIGCRKERARQWAVRCVHEAQLHEFNCFVTLTYDEAHLPYNWSVSKRDLQLFFKRLRKDVKFRYFACGEYGELGQRPHYHALLFGVYFNDRKLYSQGDGYYLWSSEHLDSVWGNGLCTFGDVNFVTAQYCAKYVCKQVRGESAREHYALMDPLTGEVHYREPEFAVMSRRPGIGFEWYRKYSGEVYPLDRVVIDGREQKPPKYYDSLLEKESPDSIDSIKHDRYIRALQHWEENLYPRLQAREKIAVVGSSLSKGSLP